MEDGMVRFKFYDFFLAATVILTAIFLPLRSIAADLRPYRPTNPVPWDDEIVISNVEDTFTTADEIFDDETIYVDRACINAGSSPAGPFYLALFIDGTLERLAHWDDELDVNWYVSVTDSSVGPLSTRTHTFKVVCDYFDQVSESDESNNEYSRTFRISPRNPISNSGVLMLLLSSSRPDLWPYKPPSWDNTLVISNVTGTRTSSESITSDDVIYVDWSCVNSGEADAGHFRYGLFIDGIHRYYVDHSSLRAGYYSYVTDSPIGPLPEGSHTLRIECDYDDEVAESNENNNEYSRSFTVDPGTKPPPPPPPVEPPQPPPNPRE